jgi:hypothetical protein
MGGQPVRGFREVLSTPRRKTGLVTKGIYLPRVWTHLWYKHNNGKGT